MAGQLERTGIGVQPDRAGPTVQKSDLAAVKEVAEAANALDTETSERAEGAGRAAGKPGAQSGDNTGSSRVAGDVAGKAGRDAGVVGVGGRGQGVAAKVGAGETALLRGAKTSTVSAVSETDAHKAADAVTSNWSVDAAKIEFAPTFSSLPKEVQQAVRDETDQNDSGEDTKGVYHPVTNTIWVKLDKHTSQQEIKGSLYHEGAHFDTLTSIP